MDMLIPLMVIIPIICALIVNTLHGHDKVMRIVSIIVAIALPVIAILASVGSQYFGGHSSSLISSALPATLASVSSLSPGIVYVFSNLNRIFIFLVEIVAFLSLFTYFSEKRKVSGPYLYLIFMGLASVTALLLSNDIFNMYIFFEIVALTQVGIKAMLTPKIIASNENIIIIGLK